MTEKILTKENIKEVAKEILDAVRKTEKNNATVVTLSGDLGAGKTTITKEIAKLLGVREGIISPTFVIMKIYKTKDKNFKKFIHIDAYRLGSSKELLQLGWDKILEDKDTLIIIEWPEQVPDCIPEDANNVVLEHRDDTTRNIKF